MQFVIRHAGVRDYLPVLQAMQQFNARRSVATRDEIWFLQHAPVYTLGLGGNVAHVLDAGGIPVVHSDRGGQVTYHGPGQLMAYVLLDLKRGAIGIRQLVQRLEQSVIDFLAQSGVDGLRRPHAPGVYVGDAKIAALGLRVRRGCCYHGLSLNVDMDTGPFLGINPCGFAGLCATQLRELGVALDCDAAAAALLPHLLRQFGATGSVGGPELPEAGAGYNEGHA